MIGYAKHVSQERGTVLILVVALLVILGLVASSFVILSHAERSSSRALSRAEQPLPEFVCRIQLKPE